MRSCRNVVDRLFSCEAFVVAMIAAGSALAGIEQCCPHLVDRQQHGPDRDGVDVVQNGLIDQSLAPRLIKLPMATAAGEQNVQWTRVIFVMGVGLPGDAALLASGWTDKHTAGERVLDRVVRPSLLWISGSESVNVAALIVAGRPILEAGILLAGPNGISARDRAEPTSTALDLVRVWMDGLAARRVLADTLNRLSLSLNRPGNQDIHYWTQGILRGFFSFCLYGICRIRLITTHATPINDSNDTPVFRLMAFARFGLG